jgi:beta-glucanase (GH16 family)
MGNGDNGWGNNELQHYTNSQSNSFYTPNHKLVLRAISNPGDPNPATRYTSARLVSRQKLDRPRGTLTAVLSVPSAPGIWPAFWLLPCEPFQWPNEGEVDIGESWNGEPTNHTCLHWGHFNPEDNDKHRVMDTHIGDLGRRPVKYEFAWDQDEGSGGGRYLWWIDGRPVMKWHIPEGFRPMREWTVLLNIAMGGNVCQGKTPPQGQFEMVVHEMRMSGECDGGWGRFEQSWWQAPEGNRM